MGIAISTHFPPPVMIESTELPRWVTHMLCWSWAMYFSAAASSENDQGSMNLASNTASVPSTMPSRVAAIQGMAECFPALDIGDAAAGIALVPGAVELLGCRPELYDEIAGEVFRLGLTPFLTPQADQGSLIAAHDDSRI